MTVAVAMLTEAEARRLTERIRTALDRVSTALADLAERITEAYQRRADLALGYDSWAEYADAELKPSEGLAADVRRQLVGMLSAQGMSTRAIAPTVGVSDRQAAYDKASAGVQLLHTSPAQPERIDRTTGEMLDPEPTPAKVTGLDGKTYPRLELKPIRREPLPETFWRVLYDTGRKVEALARLTEDDRFRTNRQAIADKNLADLRRTASTLAGVLAAIESNLT